MKDIFILVSSTLLAMFLLKKIVISMFFLKKIIIN